MSGRVGIDIGGTFTDFVLLDEAGGMTTWKEDSTPHDPLVAVERGLRALAGARGLELSGFVADVDAFVHGSTIATNALIQRSGGSVGLICTKGFRDVLYFRDGFKPDRFNIHLPRPRDLVDRYLRIGVEERVDSRGEVMRPLVEDDVVAAAERFGEAGVEAVAVALLWSVVNPAHEDRVAEIVVEHLPGVQVLCSHDVLPETREWQRTSATVISAYVLPRVGDYLRRFERLLVENGARHRASYMQINGGIASVDEVMRRPVTMVHSGPAAAPSAAAHAVDAGNLKADASSDRIITVDMGGTSFDVCMVRDGQPAMSRLEEVQSQPLGVPAVEIATIGAGGGSIGWVDGGGALRVGPQSAGAMPGPVCYDAGGERPTVTDANVVLGYLSPNAFLGGRRALRADLAYDAIASAIAEPLGLEVLRAAYGIVEVVNANMVAGIRSVSVERGVDPRDHLLLCAGGAGALHATRLARQLGMSRVLIPPQGSTFCALGMTVTDTKHDHAVSHHAHSTDLDLGELDRIFARLEDRARRRLREDGIDEERIDLRRSVDARYRNQVWELTIPIPRTTPYGPGDLETMVETFHRDHERQFTYAIPDAPVEFLHWRVTAVGRTSRLPLSVNGNHASGSRMTAAGERDAFIPEVDPTARIATPVYRVEAMSEGARVEGPALLDSSTTTILIGPDDVITGSASGSLLIEVGAAAQ